MLKNRRREMSFSVYLFSLRQVSGLYYVCFFICKIQNARVKEDRGEGRRCRDYSLNSSQHGTVEQSPYPVSWSLQNGEQQPSFTSETVRNLHCQEVAELNFICPKTSQNCFGEGNIFQSAFKRTEQYPDINSDYSQAEKLL